MPAERALCDRREAGFHLIETMRREKRAGIVRRDRHLARLENSARMLGFTFDRHKAEDMLSRLEPKEDLERVRLTLERDGRCEAQAFPFKQLEEGTVWRVRIAAVRLDSADPLLRHKTSLREVYEAARAEVSPDEADEVLLLNEKGEACEGTITSLFVDAGDGVLITPPLTSGLLDGVFRAEMIAQGKAREAVVAAEALAGAKRLFVGNSLRGLIPAMLADKR